MIKHLIHIAVLFFVALFCTSLPSSAAEADLQVNFHERLPYYSAETDGVGGIIGERVMAVFKEVGINCTFKQTPPKRQLAIIKANNGKNCIIGWFKNTKREAYARFSLPIYRDKPQMALVRNDSSLPEGTLAIKTLLSMKDMRLLTKNGYSYGARLDALIRQHAPKTVSVTTENVKMLKMIRGKRAEYMFIAPEEASQLISLSGHSKSDFRLVALDGVPPGNNRYLLFSKQVPPALVDRVNEVINSLYPI